MKNSGASAANGEHEIIDTVSLDDGRFVANRAFLDILKTNNIGSASTLWELEGEDVKKQLAIRGTERIFLDSTDGSSKVEAYIKRYLPLPFKEYFKNIISRRPFFPKGAEHEWDAIRAFWAAGIKTMKPMAVAALDDGRGALLTLGITGYKRASDLLAEWDLESAKSKRLELVKNIAKLAGKMHSAGFAHQDFYLVHLFVLDDFTVMPIDLQRVVFPDRFSKRWQVKDLGQLLYAARKVTTPKERNAFWEVYVNKADVPRKSRETLLAAVKRKADSIERHAARKRAKGRGK